jgi:hypothetical protein
MRYALTISIRLYKSRMKKFHSGSIYYFSNDGLLPEHPRGANKSGGCRAAKTRKGAILQNIRNHCFDSAFSITRHYHRSLPVIIPP